MDKQIKRIAVFTSGGDAPGMNAAIRAVVRTGAYYGLHMFGIQEGYEGMIKGKIARLEPRDVANIIHRGGTILKTARSQQFMTREGRKAAFESLSAHDIDACIAIGGNGTFTGASVFASEHQIPFVGIPGTIDNDLYGTDFTIGFDTAVNTAIEAVDRIRDTADSHNRFFIIEVMGRNSGFIALSTAIGSGAEAVMIPEKDNSLENLVELLRKSTRKQKLFSLVIVAEGNKHGNAYQIADAVREHLNDLDIKVTIIGHLQRGGAPSSMDRVLASRLGFAAVEALLNGKHNVMVGISNKTLTYTPFEQAISTSKDMDADLLNLAEILAL